MALEHGAPGRHRVLVVDDGSAAEHRSRVAEVVAGLDRDARVLSHETNQGFKEAILTAMRCSTARYVLLLNDDTIPTADFDLKLLAVMRGDPRTRAVGPVSNHPTDLFQYRPQLRSIASDGELDPVRLAARFLERQREHGTTEAPFLTGMCLLLDREAFEQAGYFDGAYEHGYFEDLELCCRMRAMGHRLQVCEDCFVYHVGHESYKHKATEEKHRIIMRNFGIYEANWSHLPEHQELLRRMEYAGQEHPI
jgi:GT2 family glycosyltransferase